MHWLFFNRYCATKAKHGEIRKNSGLEAAWSNTLLIVHNLTVPSAITPIPDGAALREIALAAAADAAPRGLPWMFGLTTPMFAGSFEEANAAMTEAGFQHLMDLTVMECDGPLAPPARPLPEVEFRRVSAGSREAFDGMQVNCISYGMPVEVTYSVVESGAYFSDPERDFGFVAYNSSGDPVSTATVLKDLDGGWAYVAAVATHPDHRQKGYAEAVIRHALAAANPSGGAKTALDASRMGRPLYAQMGYVATCRWDLWMPQQN